MTIDHKHLMGLSFAEREFTYDQKDTLLYALSVGMGRQMPGDLNFVYEKSLQALPTQTSVIAWEDTWQEATGMDISQIVHGEQRVTLHQPLAPAGRVRSRFRIADVFDKGAGKGAVVLAETALFDAGSGAPLATLLSTVFARGDGGFGGPAGKGPAPHVIPDRQPDRIAEVQVRPEQALFYRLCGDRNPLHVEPAFAKAAGFDRPILHGLCTWGMTAAVVVREACSGDARRVKHFEARFTAAVFPGETLQVQMWEDPGAISFRTRVVERNVTALDHGLVRLAP